MDEHVEARHRGGKVVTGIKIFITAIVSIVIQFGLAIAGWGGWSPFFCTSGDAGAGMDYGRPYRSVGVFRQQRPK